MKKQSSLIVRIMKGGYILFLLVALTLVTFLKGIFHFIRSEEDEEFDA